MCQKTIQLILLLFIPLLGLGQAESYDTLTLGKQKLVLVPTILESANDGPYIFIEDGELVEKNIVKGEVVRKVLPKDAYPTKFKRDKSKYKKVKKIAVLSDLHGQYDLAVEILTNNQIIDKNQNWNYEKGHLIIVGDIFDRGPKVNETLWLLYNLEQQAEVAGGQVHVILGNHEYMIFQQDVRYIHKKYAIISHLLETSYSDMYGKDTVIGRWLRAKSTVVKINDNTFVHGGFSKAFLENGYNMSLINKEMSQSIDMEEDELNKTNIYSRYFGDKGPVWYRGYFQDNLPDEEVSEILSTVSANHIVVGHCSNETVVELYDGKIYGVDSSIKLGKYGELLFIEDGKYYRGTKDGKRLEFKSKS